MLILWNFGTSTATLMFVFFSSGIFGPPLSYWLIFQVIDIGRFNFPAYFVYWLGNILKIHRVSINNCGTYNSNKIKQLQLYIVSTHLFFMFIFINKHIPIVALGKRKHLMRRYAYIRVQISMLSTVLKGYGRKAIYFNLIPSTL